MSAAPNPAPTALIVPTAHIHPHGQTDIRELYRKEFVLASNDRSGIDIPTPREVTIWPGETVKVGLGVVVAVYHGARRRPFFLAVRSSIVKTPLILHNGVGVIDSTYDGELIACFRNVGGEPYTIRRGTALVQVCLPSLDPLSAAVLATPIGASPAGSARGAGGFGSTGAAGSAGLTKSDAGPDHVPPEP